MIFFCIASSFYFFDMWQANLLSPSRFSSCDGSLQWGWPGFYAEAYFTGETLRGRIDTGERAIAIAIDQKVVHHLPVQTGIQDFHIRIERPGPHTLRIQDCSDQWHSPATLYSLEFPDGEWLPPQKSRPLFFEFIGDSWTAGWGNLNSECQASDCTQSYAALLANHFHADYSLIAAAGQGVAKNYGETPPSAVNLAIQAQLTLPTGPEIWQAHRSADWVFVLAGENDHSFAPWPSAELFTANLRKILYDARQRSPHAKIALICIERPHINPERIRAVHAQEIAAGFSTLLLQCPDFSSDQPLGYLWHPGLEHHRQLARQLAGQLEQLGLNPA